MDVGNRGRRFGTLGDGFPRGLEREGAAQASSASWRGIAYSENAQLAYCVQWPWSGCAMRRHNAERNRNPKWIKYVRSALREYALGVMESCAGIMSAKEMT